MVKRFILLTSVILAFILLSTSCRGTVTVNSSIPSTTTQASTTAAVPTTSTAPITTTTAPTTAITPSTSPTAASTISPASISPNGLTATYLDFSFEDDPSDQRLNFFIKLSDINYVLLAMNGNISIKIWNQPDPGTDVMRNPVIQHWDGVPVTIKDFVTGVGFEITVKYQDFIPDIDQSVYVKITFTADKIDLSSAQTITINKSACCS